VKAMCIPGATSHGGLGVVINASRSVLFPDARDGESWNDAVKREAAAFAGLCSSLLD